MAAENGQAARAQQRRALLTYDPVIEEVIWEGKPVKWAELVPVFRG